MSPLVEKIDRLLFPEKLRRFITFRVATLFVVVVVVGSSASGILRGPGLPLDAAEQIHKLAHSPGLLTLHALVLVVGSWLIYWTREKEQYYRLRVLFYGMLLGGLAAEILDLLVPLSR
jgi:hypothetical protein